MRYALFFFVVLFPSVAFATGWHSIPSPPLDYLVASNVFAAIAAIFYVLSGRQEKRWIPETIIAVSIVGGFGIAVLAYYSDSPRIWGFWSNLSGLFSLILLVLPYLAMKVETTSKAKKMSLVALLFVFGLFFAVVTRGVFVGKQDLAGDYPDITTQVVF